MKPKNNKQSVLWTSLAVFAIACSGTGALSEKLDGGETQANLGLKVQAAPTSTTALTALIEAQNLTVESGQACISEIRLKLPDNMTCDDAGFVAKDNVKCEVETETEDGVTKTESKIKATGPFLFDLVTGESTPSLADVGIPSGVYREIEFRFGAECNLGEETTITLNGSMLDSSDVAHPFEMKLEFDDDLKIESPTDIQVLEGQTNGVFANLILNQWFAAVDFVGCIDSGDLVANGDGVIEINKDTDADGECDEIYDDLKDAIKDSMEFEDHDHNDDGIDDDGENHDGGDDNGGDDGLHQ